MITGKAARAGLIICGLLCSWRVAGQPWVPTAAPVTNWKGVACSANGMKVVAVADGIYVSTNAGVTWTQTSAIQVSSIASSADGNTLIAAGNPGTFISRDGGATWPASSLFYAPLASCACSGDASRIVLVARQELHGGGGIAISTNADANWSLIAGYFVAATCSADGVKLVAAENLNLAGALPLRIFDDFGGTWYAGATDPYWQALACSANGSRMFAAGVDLHNSSDSGAHWSTIPNLGFISSIACSADGSKVVAGQSTSIYTSTDSGETWVSNSVPSLAWSSVASSADGCCFFAAVNGGGIYTSKTTPSPVLQISKFGDSLLLSWIVPSMEFGLQESVDLTNWSGVGVSAVLNFTNLHEEITLPLPTGPRFYRLAGQQ